MFRTGRPQSIDLPLQRQTHFLMCQPHHFGVKYSINPWMDPDAWAAKACYFTGAADLQWQTLYELLVARGVKVEIISAKKSGSRRSWRLHLG